MCIGRDWEECCFINGSLNIFDFPDAPAPEIECIGDCTVTEGGLEVLRGGRYQIICSVYDAAPQIGLYMPNIYYKRRQMLNTDTCRANISSITSQLSNTAYTSFTCSTHTHPNGLSLSNTTISITVGEYHAVANLRISEMINA